MKKLFLPLLVCSIAIINFSCDSVGKVAGYLLNERDADAAIRQMLEIGTRDGVNGAFSKDRILSTIFPEPVKKVLTTLQQLGFSNEIDRFTTTLSTASEKTAERSVPIFVGAINKLRVRDAIQIIKNGGTAATDYLRTTTGDSLRHAITPVMETTLDEYHLNEQWNKLIQPAKLVAGNKLNLDLPNLMAGLVSEMMFQKMAEKERQIRTDAAARTTPLLQKVFSRAWN